MLALKSLSNASTRSPANAIVPAMASRKSLSVFVAVDLLAQVHRQRLRRPARELSEELLRDLGLELGRHLAEQVFADAVDGFLGRHPAAAAASLGHRGDDRVDHARDREGAERQVRVRVQTENLGGFLRREVFDRGAKLGDVRLVGDDVPFEQLEALLQRPLVEVLPRVRVHEKLVERIRDSPAVLNLRDHVRHRRPRRRVELLGVHLHRVVLQKLHARAEVGLVELVQDVPPDRAKLPALLDDRVHVAHHEEHLPPLVPPDGVEH
eukprot:13234-Pelagococcus_subviridis.AAC.1